MKKVILVLLLIGCFCRKGSSQPVQFQNLTWREALAKAKQENKAIFIDIYTTWCTYCRQMDQNIFSQNEVGKWHNEHFINVRYDALRADGSQVRKLYTLLGFPTFLYLDPNGLVLLKTAGYQGQELFLQNGEKALRSLSQR